MEIFVVLFIAVVALFVVLALIGRVVISPEEIDGMRLEQEYGPINQNMICPHCTAKGHIRTKPITQKKGVSGGKATAAVLTGGISLLATGLSRKEKNTQAYCCHCQNAWYF